jgi:hypothetical protein
MSALVLCVTSVTVALALSPLARAIPASRTQDRSLTQEKATVSAPTPFTRLRQFFLLIDLLIGLASIMFCLWWHGSAAARFLDKLQIRDKLRIRPRSRSRTPR